MEGLSDRNLFIQIRDELLPQNGTISFLREQDFAGSFRMDNIEDLFKITAESKKSDFEFLNPELEAVKKDMVSHIAHMIVFAGVNTFTTQNGMQSIPSDWEIDREEHYWETVNNLNQTASDICDIYDEFIRRGRRILKV